MSISVSWSLTGPDLSLASVRILKAMTTWSDDVGPDIRDALKEATPKRTGMMAMKERYDRETTGKSVTLNFTAHSSYAPYPIYGTRPHRIYPVSARYLHFFWERKGIEMFVGPRGMNASTSQGKNWVDHPGNKPNPFPTRVLDFMQDEITQKFHQYVNKALSGG